MSRESDAHDSETSVPKWYNHFNKNSMSVDGIGTFLTEEPTETRGPRDTLEHQKARIVEFVEPVYRRDVG